MTFKINRVIRRQTSYAPGQIIDAVISKEDNELLYDRWNDEEWGRKIEYVGGIFGISCDMILAVPENKFKFALRKGGAGERIWEAATKHA